MKDIDGLTLEELRDKLYLHKWSHKMLDDGFEWPSRRWLSIDYPWLNYKGVKSDKLILVAVGSLDIEITTADQLRSVIRRLSVLVMREALTGYASSTESMEEMS